jgi:hypothetical protein
VSKPTAAMPENFPFISLYSYPYSPELSKTVFIASSLPSS